MDDLPLIKKCLAVAAALLIILCSMFGYWATAPLTIGSNALEVTIKPGASLKAVAAQLEKSDLPVNATLFEWLGRIFGLATNLKAGNYAFYDGITPYEILQKIARGEAAFNQYAIKIIEGWTFSQMRAEVDQHPALLHNTIGMTEKQLLQAIGATEDNAEGLFFPDTYFFDKDESDLVIYKRIYQLAQRRLDQAWQKRAPNLPYKTPYEALIAASLVEKETGHRADRPLVAAVLINRLRVGMPLQTDPTIIYGMAQRYKGKISKKDLRADNIYNTYTRAGLPPTPIALPGAASLDAALNPAASQALYFVSRGDGSSEFSNTLIEHNRAVNKFIRTQP